MSNQSLKQQTCRTDASSSETYNGDWIALTNTSSGTFNERVLEYLNSFSGSSWDVSEWDEVLWGPSGTTHTNINEAMADFAKANGIDGPGSLWSQLGNF